ncbi:MAG: YchJ family protein [Burkholderiaceae bacterium]
MAASKALSATDQQPGLTGVSTPFWPCPCGSNRTYVLCCRPFHRAEMVPTAERLMRARYSAYVLRDTSYLLGTWHPTKRPERLDPGFGEPGVQWLGLEIREHAEIGDDAVVEFVARYKGNGRAVRLHEVSRFVREAGSWWYLDGTFPKAVKQ